MIYERKNSTQALDEGIRIKFGKDAPDEFLKFAVDFFTKINRKMPLENQNFRNEILEKKDNHYFFQIEKENRNIWKAAGHAGVQGALYGMYADMTPEARDEQHRTHEEEKKLKNLIDSCGMKVKSNNGLYDYQLYRFAYSKDKSYIYVAWPTVGISGKYYSNYGIHIKCISNTTKNRRNYQVECAGVANKPIRILTHNSQGKLVIENGADPINSTEALFFADDPLRDMKNTPELTQYVTYPSAVDKAINEYFDMTDNATRRTFLFDEATATSVLTGLTNRLYNHIVKKTTSIDYGSIPQTKGDITKLTMYDDLKDVCEIIKGIVKEFGEKSGPIDTVTLAMANVESRKDLFTRAYRADCELPVMLYENTVLAIVSATSYLIAGCIELIKAPSDETYKIQLDKLAYSKSRDHLLYTTLDKFNKACEKGDVDKACNEVIGQRVRKFTGVAAGIIAGTIVGIVVIMNIVPLLRELVYLHFYTRTKIADFFNIQADLLQMNAYNVEANGAINPEQRKDIAKKQQAIADNFRSVANKIQIDQKQAEVKASREIESNARKYKVDDITNQDVEDDGADGVSSLF